MNLIQQILPRLRVNVKTLIVYVIVYYCWGYAMNEIGIYAEIARFQYRFQIFTCYILFMVPVSLVLRGLPWYQQYAYGVVLMGIFEFGGYALETSVAYPNNILGRLFNVRNFSLGMTLFFGSYFPLGNWLISKIENLLALNRSSQSMD